MKLDKNIHREIMLRILADISSDPLLSNNLGFKGGTACYFLYGLDRFSVDLDFDILDEKKEDQVKENLLNLLGQYGTIKTRTSIKLKYSDEYQALKIDLSSRYDMNKLNFYKIEEVVSRVPIKVLQKEDIFAHKLIALTNRNCAKGEPPTIANRDLYDINFFFKQGWKFNEKIISEFSKKTVADYLVYAYNFIEKNVNEKNILDRLGDLVDEEKRNFVKKNLKNNVLVQLSIQIKNYKLV